METILYFVAAFRNADLHLYLQAGEALNKLFFAMDRLEYKRLMLHSRYACTPDRSSRHMERTGRGKNLCAKKYHPLRVSWCWPRMRAAQHTHEGPRWAYWDLQQPQCKTAIPLGYSRTFPKVKREHGTITRIKEAIESHGNPFAVYSSDTLFHQCYALAMTCW